VEVDQQEWHEHPGADVVQRHSSQQYPGRPRQRWNQASEADSRQRPNYDTSPRGGNSSFQRVFRDPSAPVGRIERVGHKVQREAKMTQGIPQGAHDGAEI
jgi:hypothetical protein